MNHKWLNLTHWSDFFFSSRTLHVSKKLSLLEECHPRKMQLLNYWLMSKLQTIKLLVTNRIQVATCSISDCCKVRCCTMLIKEQSYKFML